MPSTPLFYQPDLALSHLTQEESHHATRVLRLRAGDPIELTDGKGSCCTCELTSNEERAAGFKISRINKIPRRPFFIHLAIAPTKNIDRMEWLVEKCTEIGVDKITFVLCKTSERPSVPVERLQKLAISAMKQSRQAWLPELVDMVDFKNFMEGVSEDQRFIAHVDNSNPDHLVEAVKPKGSSVILVGPEGDFTSGELTLALEQGFQKVSLGPNRLRTETAGVFAVAVMNLSNSRA